MAYQVFANHAHVFQKEVKPNATIDNLKMMMEEAGVAKAVAFAPFINFEGTQMKSRDENPNRWLASQLENEKDIVGFGTIDFTRDDLKDQVSEIQELGLLGIKIHPAHQRVKINGERAFEVYRRAEECGLFISFHTGIHRWRISDYEQLLFDDVAFSFPKLKFSMEHIGGYCFFKESVAVMTNQRGAKENPRIFAGWTSIFERGGWHISTEQLEDLIYMTGDNAHVFGLDFPYKNAAYIKNAISIILSLNISDEAKGKILGGNLARELGVKL